MEQPAGSSFSVQNLYCFSGYWNILFPSCGANTDEYWVLEIGILLASSWQKL
jgi:hypothetical protein